MILTNILKTSCMELEQIITAVGVSERGLCRDWVRKALMILEDNLDKAKIEVREVQTEPTVYHSFIKLLYNENSYFLDGTGTGKHSPYFGLETDAPQHLQNSKRDMINSYIENR